MIVPNAKRHPYHDMPTAITETSRTPLLDSVKMDPSSAAIEVKMKNNNNAPPSSNANNEQELQFYDPATILNVSREVAFGYLILLAGDAVAEYEAPTREEVSQRQPSHDDTRSQDPTTNSKSSAVAPAPPDEETASLAYAAIVDGNVLHACFGLKAGGNGRASNAGASVPRSERSSSSMFCCFPAASRSATLDALQSVLPHLTANKLRMQNLAEILREVRDLHLDAMFAGATTGASTAARDSAKASPYILVIRGYIHCFTAVVRYHDTKKHFKDGTVRKGSRSKSNGIVDCCSKMFNRLLSKKNSNPQLEKLQADTLQDIEHGFRGVREKIWEGLEDMATETAFTGVSIDH